MSKKRYEGKEVSYQKEMRKRRNDEKIEWKQERKKGGT